MLLTDRAQTVLLAILTALLAAGAVSMMGRGW